MSKNNVAEIVPDKFWEIIGEARQSPKGFREILRNLNREQIIDFYWTYEELANHLRNERYLPYVHPDLSEDGLAELANWVVAQGKTYYSSVLDHPDLIPPKKNDAGLLSEALDEYEERYNEDIPSNTRTWDNDWKQHGKTSPWA